jgi:hypothetical protein
MKYACISYIYILYHTYIYNPMHVYVFIYTLSICIMSSRHVHMSRHTHTHTHTLVQRPLGVTGALKHPGRLPIAPADGNTDAASCSHYMSLSAAFSITCTTQYCSTRLITTFGFFTTFSTHYCSRRSLAAEGRTAVAG